MSGGHQRRRRCLAVAVAVLVAANLAAHVAAPPVGSLAVPVGALVVLGVGRWAWLSWAEMGLARATWGSGARLGAVVAGVVLAAVAVVASVPLTRSAFLDTRYHLGAGAIAFKVLIEIPLQTVIPEEIAFRAVLLGLLKRDHGTRPAIVIASVLFGLWHITSSLGLSSDNQALAAHIGGGNAAVLLTVLGAVLATAAAGVVFCGLRLRASSVLAPMTAHWALNSAGVLASAALWALTTR